MANILPKSKQVAIIPALTEGCSIRSTARIVGVSRETVLRYLVKVGEGCAKLMDEKMHDLNCRRLEMDEIWAFIGCKQYHLMPKHDESTMGDMWTFVAIDAETKLIPAWLVGKRGQEETDAFIADVASRLRNRVQISTDGLRLYIDAIEDSFGCDVDYAQIVKEYEVEPVGPGRYSPPQVSGTEKNVIMGNPVGELISTSYIERQNLTMRMRMRRFTRLTNAFSKKLRNHKAAVALHFAAYNFTTIHGTLRVTPAMAAGVTDRVWSLEELVDAAAE